MLTREEMIRQMNSEGEVSGQVKLKLYELIGCDYKGFPVILSLRLTNTPYLTDIEYEVAGVDAKTKEIIISVTGDAGELLCKS